MRRTALAAGIVLAVGITAVVFGDNLESLITGNRPVSPLAGPEASTTNRGPSTTPPSEPRSDAEDAPTPTVTAATTTTSAATGTTTTTTSVPTSTTTTTTPSGHKALIIDRDTVLHEPFVLRPGDTVEFRNGARLECESGCTIDIQGTPTTTWSLRSDWATNVSNPVSINLERDILLFGQGHLFIGPDADGPHTIKWARFDVRPKHELGHYPIHFHLNRDRSRGTLVEGVVVTNSTNRAFVPHGSNGITMRNNIAVNTFGGAFGWDNTRVGDPPKANHSDDSHNVVWDRNLSFGFTNDPNLFFGRPAFQLGRGNGNVATRNVSVNANGSVVLKCAHYSWPESGSGVWTFRDNVAIGGNCPGVMVWQNSPRDHVIARFEARGGGLGIRHGAYSNAYRYIDVDVDAAYVEASRSGADAPGPLFQGGRIGVLQLGRHVAGTGLYDFIGTQIGSVHINNASHGCNPDKIPHYVFSGTGITFADVSETGEGACPGTMITVDGETRTY